MPHVSPAANVKAMLVSLAEDVKVDAGIVAMPRRRADSAALVDLHRRVALVPDSAQFPRDRRADSEGSEASASDSLKQNHEDHFLTDLVFFHFPQKMKSTAQ